MMIQYTIIATILAACILYAAFRIYKSLQQANKCKDGNYRCSGCAFYEQCKKKGKLDNTNKKLDSTDKKLDSTDKKLDSTKRKLDSTKRKLDSTKRKLDPTDNH